jgi:hypothetical protein
MHLEGPWLSTTSTKKRKTVKFKSAEHKAKYMAEKDAWEKMLKKLKINQDDLKKRRAMSSEVYKPTTDPFYRKTEHIPSLNSPDCVGVATKKAPPVYTGTLIKGIATMHKSNAVPVFNDEQAKDIAKMRR